MRVDLRLCALVLGLLAVAVDTTAADIRLARSPLGDPLPGITIEGEIVPGDFIKFRALVLSTPGANSIWLASPGGHFTEALRIGRLIRALNLEVWAPLFPKLQFVSLTDPANNTCSSACFFLYAGGVRRFGGHVGVHRPFLSKEEYQSMRLEQAAQAYSWIEEQTGAYLKEMGVPPKYLPMIMATNSGEILWLSETDIGRDFEGIIREYDDWFRAVCPHLSASQTAEDERLRQIVIRKGELSEQELAFRDEVVRIRMDGEKCTDARLREVQERSRQTILAETLRAANVAAPGLKNGFADLSWGSRPGQDMLAVKPSETGLDAFQSFMRRDTPRVANRETAFVVYSYYDGGLCRVTIGLDGIRGIDGLRQVGESLNAAWGPSSQLSSDGTRAWLSPGGATVAILRRPKADNSVTLTSAVLTISSTACVDRMAKQFPPTVAR